jgi:hypothetical protein
MYQMLKRAGEKDLGFEGYPASAGLFYTIIAENGLYQNIKGSHILPFPTEIIFLVNH